MKPPAVPEAGLAVHASVYGELLISHLLRLPCQPSRRLTYTILPMLTLHNAKIVFPRRDLGTLVLGGDRPKMMQFLWVMIGLRWVCGCWCVSGLRLGGAVIA